MVEGIDLDRHYDKLTQALKDNEFMHQLGQQIGDDPLELEQPTEQVSRPSPAEIIASFFFKENSCAI